MREGLTIAKDGAGNPTLLADTRTPIMQQERSMALLKAGVMDPPDGAKSVELWCNDGGLVSRWIATGKPTQPKIQPKKGKKDREN